MHILHIQELPFPFQSSGVAGQAVFSHHSVTGDEQWNGIPVAGLSYGPGVFGPADLTGNVAVSSGLSPWDLPQGLPDLLLEGRTPRVKGQLLR